MAPCIVLLVPVAPTLVKWVEIGRRFPRLVRSGHIRIHNYTLVHPTTSFGAISNYLSQQRKKDDDKPEMYRDMGS